MLRTDDHDPLRSKLSLFPSLLQNKVYTPKGCAVAFRQPQNKVYTDCNMLAVQYLILAQDKDM